ncbi:peptidase U32 family protein [Vaginisenegalia massiliensis]|uniref:peptidase U32 family protein n=1 Tax=Vaginisenegalia massiliensis TaxID=2058294 RepID=UPI000F527E08|nr:peptidase U32 family protein [Vaginisenegalia massiliensis]
MIELIATVESIQQAEGLLEAGVDCLYFGQDEFGLRLPYSFSREEQAHLIKLAHQAGKKVSVAVNAIFHNEGIDQVPDYLRFLKEQEVDTVTVGDPGVLQKMKVNDLFIPYRYDAQVMVTSSRQVNFWAKRGAVAAVLAREVPKVELERLAADVTVPVEFLVYGATCIHQSRRPLIQNYFNYIKKTENVGRDRGIFLSEPRKGGSHYSVYEDVNGTHVFANNDVLLASELQTLADMNVTQWKLEGLFSPGENFVKIASLFNQARQQIEAGTWTEQLAQELEDQVRSLHPQVRELDTGFFLFDKDLVK